MKHMGTAHGPCMHWHAAAPVCVRGLKWLVNIYLTPFPHHTSATLSYMHEYHSQHRVVTTYYSYTSLAVFLAKHVGKHSSRTFYVAFRDPGQILIIRDCPGDSARGSHIRASPVETFATGIKVESSDQRSFLEPIKGSRRILSD